MDISGLAPRTGLHGFTVATASALCAVGVVLPACVPSPAPPLPTDPEAWLAEAEGLSWQGRIEEGWSATFSATKAEVRWSDGRVEGRFDTLIVGLLPEGADVEIAVVTARTAEGAWPAGPLVMQDAAWDIDGRAEGRAPRVTWLGGGRWSCGGCPMEVLASEVATRGLSALGHSQ